MSRGRAGLAPRREGLAPLLGRRERLRIGLRHRAADPGRRRLRHGGTLDGTWRTPVGRSRKLAGIVRVGDTLYADDGYRVFAVSADDGRLLWTSARAQRGSLVGILTIAATRTTVYIGGYLTVVGKSPLHQLAALDARTGRLLPWRPPQLRLYPGSAPVVTRLALSPRRLYVGGSFTSVGGVARKDGIAAFRLAGRRLTGFAPRSTVWNISALTAAGKLVLIGGPEGGGAFDARTSARRPGLEPLPSASAIAVRGRVAYLGGDLRTTIGGDNLLALDLATGKLKSWFPKLARYVSVGTIVPAGDRAFVGGQFCSTLG